MFLCLWTFCKCNNWKQFWIYPQKVKLHYGTQMHLYLYLSVASLMLNSLCKWELLSKAIHYCSNSWEPQLVSSHMEVVLLHSGSCWSTEILTCCKKKTGITHSAPVLPLNIHTNMQHFWLSKPQNGHQLTAMQCVKSSTQNTNHWTALVT